AATRPPADPLDVSREASLQHWPEVLRARYLRNLQPAGVLIPVVERRNGLGILLTQRSAALSQHAGQISFPGGRMEKGDADVLATALRETHEEIGIPPDLVDIAGYLDPSPTISGYAVTPVVGFVAEGFKLRIDPEEVDFAFEVPLDFLLEAKNLRHSERVFEGHRIPVSEFVYDEHRIWGATASFLIAFAKIINN
ncbi:MAG: CoA pyrophosphatase, partial [Gammaproteobacteria bacterium]|nr:CoA pyrophosphatase [Gammaproteobacteria bacterium]